ncbi:phospholipid scramblase 1-like [Phyllobates terribilis]|uniref:phospholipid scramblase 1-like n=1 Tax=Phyllobates terribilis TaxID=111132 RepID=UPI003CCAB840
MKKQEQQNEPVQTQPQLTGAVSPWTPAPAPSSLQGLEYLSQVSQMLVQLKSTGLLLRCTRLIFDIKNSMGQQVYTVTEDFNCLLQYMFMGYRSFTRRISDNTGGLVMEVYKPFECPIFPYCQTTKAEVKTASGVPMAYIVKGKNPWFLTFKILNENSEEVLKITATSCFSFSNIYLKVTTIQENTEVGMIVIERNFSTLKFHVRFSLDLDVKMKAAILATCLLFGV